MDFVLIVYYFLDALPSNIPGVPLDRILDFSIDLKLWTKPISIPLYCMDLVRVKGSVVELVK